MTGWRVRTPLPYWEPVQVLGVLLLLAGVVVLVHSFVRFVVEGVGTPAPIAPPQHLVVGGFYRYVRNPIYLALVFATSGQSLLLGQPSLLWYAAGVGPFTAAVVKVYEEPKAARPVRRRVRHLPPGGTRLVAPGTPMAAG